MKVVTKDFLNENVFLSYPIDSRATYEPYTESEISRVNSLLVDIRLMLPTNVANSAFIASIKVSESIVSMVIMGTKEAIYYDGNLPPTPSLESSEYSAFSAVVLATVTADRAQAIAQIPVEIVGEIPGVGGWVIFGPGVENEGSWSFAGPASSAISTLAVSKYEYSGVYTVAAKGFQNKLDGAITLVGENGIEVVPVSDKVLSIRFSGSLEDIRQGLDEYRGECGIRPETDTCLSRPIRSINNLKPTRSNSGKNQIVLVLDKPLYGRLTPNSNPTQFGISSNVPIDSFCGTRLIIPDTECSAGQTAPAVLPNSSNKANDAIAEIPQGTEFILEAIHMGVSSALRCAMHQQHPLRPAVSVFKPVEVIQLLGEQVLEVHVDTTLNQWQVYNNSGPSLRLFGPLGFNFTGFRDAELNGMPIKMTFGPMNRLDRLNIKSLIVSEDAEDPSGLTGTYSRKHYGYYLNENNSAIHLKVIAANNSWTLYENNVLKAAGTFDEKGRSTQVQNYSDSKNQSKIRIFSIVGVS
jgi:hypothetical protein